MNTQRFALVLSVVAIVLTAMNLVVLLSILSRPAAVSNGVADVLRAHEFQVVDAHGRVRAQIAVLPPSTGPDGRGYAETVLLRLIDPNGRPGVKIGTSVDGSAMSLEGDSERTDWSGVQLLADNTASVVKLTNKDGSVLVVQP